MLSPLMRQFLNSKLLPPSNWALKHGEKILCCLQQFPIWLLNSFPICCLLDRWWPISSSHMVFLSLLLHTSHLPWWFTHHGLWWDDFLLPSLVQQSPSLLVAHPGWGGGRELLKNSSLIICFLNPHMLKLLVAFCHSWATLNCCKIYAKPKLKFTVSVFFSPIIKVSNRLHLFCREGKEAAEKR